jgi:hypothetical protein
MQTVSTQYAADLPPGAKSAAEQILGRPIGADEEVSIVAVPPQQIPPSRGRAFIAQLENPLNRRAAKVRDTCDEEIDAARLMRPSIRCAAVSWMGSYHEDLQARQLTLFRA